jgi:ubiquitin-protein ligase
MSSAIRTSMKPSAVKRLLQDLEQLRDEPIVGANAEPFGDDIAKWYAIVMGAPGSPYENIPIRFVLEFPDDYPNSAPNAFFETDVKYHGGASYRDASGRQVVCLNIFGNFGHVHTEWKNMSEGWTPSYTVTTVLVSMQGLMMSDMLTKSPSEIALMRSSAAAYKCPVTGHDGSKPETWFPNVPTFEDVQVKLASRAKTVYDPLKDHYICYVKRSTAKDGAVLGYGVNIDNQRIGTLSSPCEYLSEEGFKEGTRRSSTNKQFEFWLPILLTSDNWSELKPKIMASVKTIIGKLGTRCEDYEGLFKVCSSIMNTLVVEIMNNKGNLVANDKFIDGYFALYRLMKQCVSESPAFQTYVDNTIQRFKDKEDKRSKQFVPNMGELLIYLTVSSKYGWNDISDAVIKECDARNVFWYAVGNYSSPAKHPELLSTATVAGRTTKVFNATDVGRSLIMFQVRFSEVARALTLEMMDSNSGLAPTELRKELRDTYNKIAAVKNWNDYFAWLHMPERTEAQRTEELIDAVRRSESQGYHGGAKTSKPDPRSSYRRW